MNKISKTLLRLAGFAALSTGFAMAQANDQLMATIPFNFTVGNTTLPPGDYTFASGFGSQVVQILDSRLRIQAVVLAIGGAMPAGPSDSRLTFHAHGRNHYRASTWNANLGQGRQMPETSAEREEEMASGPATQVVLLARR